MAPREHDASLSEGSSALLFSSSFAEKRKKKNEQEKLQSNSVLIVGMKGLGLEIAKNIVLMGVKHLTICDNSPVQLRDLSSNFFLSEADVGKPRAVAVRAKLQELNDRCELKLHDGVVTEELVSQFRVVVLTDNKSREELVRLAEACHRANVGVIAADCWGVFGWTFVDLGAEHTISDRTGERNKTGYLASFNRDNKEGICVCIDRHDLEDGMVVQLSEVSGIPSLNNKQYKVRTLGPFIFSIGDVSEHEGEYIKGGLFEEVKVNTTVSFESLGTQLGKPFNMWEYLVPTDHAKMMDAPQQMLLLLALLEFRAAHDGNLPRNMDRNDASEVLDNARALNAQVKHVEDQIDERLIGRLASVSRGDLGPLAAVFGGIIAQEVIKASSSKYTPIRQWSFFDAREVLPVPVSADDAVVEAAAASGDFTEEGTRYDGQIAVFGKAFQAKLADLHYFLVGAGAIGCEMLKNWACMGMGTGPRGSILVTDNDIIEISNLNRQFLYRAWDVQHSKSETSAKAAAVMNPAMKIKAYTTKVCTETEDVFNDEFWTGLDGVCNALDNIHARLYVDSKCVFFGKSLLESGTLGTKGNTQVMVPGVSQTYGETSDPEPKETAKCLLHSFPSNVEHCLAWARELLFEGEFVVNPEEANNYIKNPSYLSDLTELDKKKKLDILASVLLDRQKNLDEVVVWARNLFEEYYVRRPAQLIHTYPIDCKDSAGQPFWQGTRRPPHVVHYDPKNSAHVDFVVASTFLRAYVLKLIPSEFKPADLAQQGEHIAAVAAAVQLAPWRPKDNVKIAVDPEKEKEHEAAGVSAEDDAHMQRILASLPPQSSLAGLSLNVLDFEKDDDRNFHIDFIYSAANLRAVAYEIPTVSRLQSKLIAGKIIPAIVTTTAVVAGLVCLELFKLALGKRRLEDYRNCFCNLAIPVFNMAEAVPPVKYKFREHTFTTWDSVKINEGDLTVQQLIDVLKSKHNITPFQINFPVKTGSKIIYMSFGDYDVTRKVSDLAREVLAKEKLKLEPLQRCIRLDVTPDDDDDGMDLQEDKVGEQPDRFPPIYFYFK